MTVNVQALEQEIKNANLRKKQFANQIDMDEATLYRKMRSDGEKFTVGEMHKIIKVLNLSKDSASAIFLFQNSQ